MIGIFYSVVSLRIQQMEGISTHHHDIVSYSWNVGEEEKSEESSNTTESAQGCATALDVSISIANIPHPNPFMIYVFRAQKGIQSIAIARVNSGCSSGSNIQFNGALHSPSSNVWLNLVSDIRQHTVPIPPFHHSLPRNCATYLGP